MPFDFPSPATNGQQVTNSNTGLVYQYDGVRWKPVASAQAGAVVIADTPPATPPVGELWFDSTGLQTYLRYNDGSSTQWVPVVNQNPGIGEAPQTGASYARNNAAWVAVSPSNVGKNLLHNGLFNVAQRGAGPWTATAYTADRWQLSPVTDAASVTLAATNDAVRTAIGDEAAANILSNTFTGNAAAGAYNFIYQPIEGVRRLAGKTVTISFYAAASVALKLGVNLLQHFGTGGSPTAPTWLATATAVQLSLTWTRYSVSIAIPSASGKTLGTNNNDSTWLALWFSSGATNNAIAGNIGVQSGTISLWGIQLELGPVATSLEKLDPRYDLANCQRFYFTAPYWVTAASAGGAGTVITFPTTMRAVPTIAGGAAGFGSGPNTTIATGVWQTTGASQTLTFSADL